MNFTDHPRLFVDADRLAGLCQPWDAEHQSWSDATVRRAGQYAKSPQFGWKLNRHNAHLLRARTMQGRVVTLLVAWKITGRDRFRNAAIEHVREMDRWRYWSWIKWRVGEDDPSAIFDLSYGENAATIAIAFDWLFDSLGDAERDAFVDIAQRRAVTPYLDNVDPDRRANKPGWFYARDSNWNTVCTGGAGMLALAMHEHLPEADRVLELTEYSFEPFMKRPGELDGGWVEGVGYWNYGMRYAFMYLLSHERATGRQHRFLKLKSTAKTLRFPLDFCPRGVSCSFGDVNRWGPLPFHFFAAERVGDPALLRRLRRRLGDVEGANPVWPLAPMLLLFDATRPTATGATSDIDEAQPHAVLYRGLDWGILRDREESPEFYLSARSGDTAIPHGQPDLLSFHCVIAGHPVVTNLSGAGYLDTTFSSRRNDLFELSPHAKNTILVNGVGMEVGKSGAIEKLQLPVGPALRLEATDAYATVCRDKPMVEFVGRLCVLLDGEAMLILDRVVTPQAAQFESRLFTGGPVEMAKNSAVVANDTGKGIARITFASDAPGVLERAQSTPTQPRPADPMLRWMSTDLHPQFTTATLITPGRTRTRVEITPEARRLHITARRGKWSSQFTVTNSLRKVRQ